MSTKAWKRTRRALRPIREKMDERKRKAMRVPWWVWLAAVLIEPHWRDQWIIGWQRRHEEKMRRAYKRTVRFTRRIGG